MKPTLTLLAALLLAQFTTTYAARPESDGTKLDITYKTTVQGSLRLDLHYPEAPGGGAKYPLVIFTHGGGWASGNKTIGDRGVRFMGVKALNAQGFCVASVERADAAKAPVEIVIVGNSLHNWREQAGALSPSRDEIMAKTAAFMKQHLDRSFTLDSGNGWNIRTGNNDLVPGASPEDQPRSSSRPMTSLSRPTRKRFPFNSIK